MCVCVGVFVCLCVCVIRGNYTWPLLLSRGSRGKEASNLECFSHVSNLPIGSIVVPLGGSYLGSYKVIPKRNYFGAYG